MNNIVQIKHQNKDASIPLIIPVLVLPNTSEEVIDEHIKVNSRKDLKWLESSDAHDGLAILCGGGPSIKGFKDEIRRLKDSGGTVFGCNGAATWLIENGIDVDIQTIIDAKLESAQLVENRAKAHIWI